ncbi:HXXEE domain-containing protein [Streptomyces sp. NPDC005908]|uniref:HXXEE domain-containing protein n=1 Tax=Streptomyces sp. NPDC005908 TaxID=3157084 RepID=UPI0033E91F67
MGDSSTDEGVGAAVTLGLPAAWAVHDLEELATVPGWLRRNAPELRRRFPLVPEPVWRRAERTDPVEFTAAVGVMGTVVAAAAVAGRLSGAAPASTGPPSPASGGTGWCTWPRPRRYAATPPVP